MDAWNDISVNFLRSLYRSIPSRLVSVVQNKEKMTSYRVDYLRKVVQKISFACDKLFRSHFLTFSCSTTRKNLNIVCARTGEVLGERIAALGILFPTML